MSALPAFDPTKHAADVVCVSIGANLLLPAAPAILDRLLGRIEVNPEKIARRNFQSLGRFVLDADLEKIARRVNRIKTVQKRCQEAPGLVWRVSEFVAACAGVFLLWAGWVDDPRVAPYSGLLLVPAVFAVVRPFLCYAGQRVLLWLCVKWIVFKAFVSMLRDGGVKPKDEEDDSIAGFVSAVRGEIGRNAPR